MVPGPTRVEISTSLMFWHSLEEIAGAPRTSTNEPELEQSWYRR